MRRKHWVRKQLSIQGNACAHVGLSLGFSGVSDEAQSLGFNSKKFLFDLEGSGEATKVF